MCVSSTIQSCAYNVLLLWLGHVTLCRCVFRWGFFFWFVFFFFHASCVCECTRGQSVNQPPIETTAHRTRLWLSGLCCQLFSCIVLLAGCLFKLSTVSHSAYMDAQLSPHTRTYSMLCNSNDCSPALHVRVEGRRVVTVCLSTWF